jgi:hypothetical protein
MYPFLPTMNRSKVLTRGAPGKDVFVQISGRSALAAGASMRGRRSNSNSSRTRVRRQPWRFAGRIAPQPARLGRWFFAWPRRVRNRRDTGSANSGRNCGPLAPLIGATLYQILHWGLALYQCFLDWRSFPGSYLFRSLSTLISDGT